MTRPAVPAWLRLPLAIGGALLLAVLWMGPLPGLARASFLSHMILHMGVIAVAAPLLVAGIAGGPFDPVRRSGGTPGPAGAALVEFVVVWSWHTPALHEAARATREAFALEQGSFLVAGLLVWLSAFGGDAAGRRARSAAGAGALLVTSMHMTLLGVLLALSPRPLYEHATIGQAARDALVEQQLGGTLMLMVGGAVYLAGGLVLVGRLLWPVADGGAADNPPGKLASGNRAPAADDDPPGAPYAAVPDRRRP